jgi:bile acid:Na+ symporter, BASS family
MNNAIEIELVNITIALFVAFSLFDMGLRLNLRDALSNLRDARFTVLFLTWGYLLCPGLAYLLTKIIPLEQPYAIGMILVGLTPCSTLLQVTVKKAHGDCALAASSILLASVLTVICLPWAVPLLAPGLAAEAATIAKALLPLVLVPMAIGLTVKSAAPRISCVLEPFVSKAVHFITYFMVLLVLSTSVYVRGFLDSIGGYAIGTLVVFFLTASAGSYFLSPGLEQRQKSVLSLGMSHRNLAIAFAPFLVVKNVDQRAMVMVALAVPLQMALSLLAARQFARHVPAGDVAAIDR